ncbi:MAG: molybdopterin-binding protein [Gammaproteobacteria bacterium SG8_47]|nr:MAG: molybdopterin-binding protein [Gammaproteobacteria bacterium SG8_47]
MRFGTIIIGSELLSGKRVDEHFGHVVQTLAARGLELSWSLLLADEPVLITRSLKRSIADGDTVFCFGGIGATPDDHTRQCAAAAAGVALRRHPEAVREIQARFGDQAYPNRILMADLPADSTLIPNPFNRIPGFSLGDHHFLPGFPQMAWPMLEWVLQTYYATEFSAPSRELRLVVEGVPESQLLDIMRALVGKFPDVSFSSLPGFRDDQPWIEFGLRGPAAAAARDWLTEALAERGVMAQRPESD